MKTEIAISEYQAKLAQQQTQLAVVEAHFGDIKEQLQKLNDKFDRRMR